MRLLLISLWVCCSAWAWGQQPDTIDQIDRYVESVRQDTTLQKVTLDSVPLTEIDLSTVKNYKVELYLKDGEVVRLVILPTYPNLMASYAMGGSVVDHYIDKGQLVYTLERYGNNSRMGSCGTLSIENHVYYHNGEHYNSFTIEKPFACYYDKIELDWLLTNFKKAYELALKKVK